MSASMPAYMSDPTEEQLAALNMAMDHKSFKVVAYAGAGKTTTLKPVSYTHLTLPTKRIV